MNPKVSIIIACYNDPYVVEAVRSAREQAYTNKEIILIDDGSDRKVAEIIQSCREQVDLVLVQSNKGQSIARNNGIRNASGAYILNLDSDDYFEPDFCEKAVACLEKDEHIKIVTCIARRFNEKGTIDIFTPKGGDVNNFLFSNSALGSSMFRKEDWNRVGGYEEKLPILGFEDWELYIHVLKGGGIAMVLKEVLFNYRIHENSTTARIKHLKNKKFKCIIQKHRDLYLENFDDLNTHLFAKLEQYDHDLCKVKNKTEFKLGSLILTPLRSIKSIFN